MECPAYWNVNWHIMQFMIDNKLQHQMESYYNHLNQNLDNLQTKLRQKLESKQTTTERSNKVRQQFHPREKTRLACTIVSIVLCNTVHYAVLLLMNDQVRSETCRADKNVLNKN